MGATETLGAGLLGTTAPPRENLLRSLGLGELEYLERSEGSPAPRLRGHFCVFEQWTLIDSAIEGVFLERFAPGALSKSIREGGGRKCVMRHGAGTPLGELVIGRVLSLEDDSTFEVELFDGLPTLLLEGLKAGEYATSFKFAVVKENFVARPPRSEHNPHGLPERTVTEALVREFGPCTFPVQQGTAVRYAMRSITDEYVRERLELPPVREGDQAARRSRMYERATEYVGASAWAMTPEALSTIVSILAERREGNAPSPEEIAARIGARAADAPAEPAPSGGPVAVIPISGPLVPHGGAMSETSVPLPSVEDLQAQVREAAADPSVGAILLELNTPGGAAKLMPEMAAEVRAADKQKPVVALVNTMAASGGYWIASAARQIISSPSGEVGSIGVFAAHEDISAAEEQRGVKTTLVSAGKYKVEKSPFEPLSEEARADMQARVNDVYGQFVKDVARGRGVTAAEVRKGYGEGRTVLAPSALKQGMIDGIATREEALAAVTRMAEAHLAGEQASAEVGPLAIVANTSGGTTTNGSMQVQVSEPERSGATTREVDRAEPERSGATTPDARNYEERKEMTIDEVHERLDAIRHRFEDIHVEYGADRKPDEVQGEIEQLLAERDDLEARKADWELTAGIVKGYAARGNLEGPARVDRSGGRSAPYTNVDTGRRLPDSIWAIAEYANVNRPSEVLPAMRDGAKRAVEQAVFPHPVANKEDNQGHIERLLDTIDGDGALSTRLLATGSPTYSRAFGKKIAGEGLTADEERAMSLTTTKGGFAVPYVLDPTLILTSNGVVNPLRQIARVETITGNTWQGLSTAGITASYTAEATEATDADPSFAQPDVNVEKAQALLIFSIEIGQDWGSLQSEAARLFQDAKDTLEADKFLSGFGHASSVPVGLHTGATAIVNTAGTAAFAIGDLYSLTEALGPRWEPRASIVGNLKQFNRVRAFDTAGGAGLWVQLADSLPSQLVGYPAYRYSNMTSAITSGSTILTFGDFSNFLIVDRIGMNVDLIEHMLGSNRLPSGQRGLYAYWRNSSDVLTYKAFVSLKVT